VANTAIAMRPGPGRRRRLSLLTIVALLAAALVSLIGLKPAYASTMSNGWTTPLASMANPADGFLADGCGHANNYLTGQFHIGADFWGSSGDPVYALGNGTVRISQSFGEGTYVVMVEHVAADGSHFVAVYGHLNDAGRPAVGTAVIAGGQIGTLSPNAANGPHLHLGILPGTTIPTSNWGNMPCPAPGIWPPTNTNGFVDPMPYLDAHKSYLSRIMGLDSSAAFAKDGLGDSWTTEAGPRTKAVAVGATGRMMVIDSAGNAYSKDGLADSWTLQFNGAAAIAVGPTGRMMVTDAAGWAYAKDSPGDSWITEAGPGVRAISVGGNGSGQGRMMVIDSAGNAYHKDALGDNWVLQFANAKAIAVGATGRMMATDAAGYAYAKDSPGSNWVTEAGPGVRDIAVGGNGSGQGRMMVIDSAGNAYHKDALGDNWVLQLNGAAGIAVGTYGRMMASTAAGYAYAKNNPGDNWILEAGPGLKAIAAG